MEDESEEALKACAGDADSLIAEATQIAFKMQAQNRRLRKALKNMLYLFDRDLRAGTLGRKICDEAKEELKTT